ncbi:MAG: hypothetical protein ACFFB5_07845 [Promethearchaeota archaeon]
METLRYLAEIENWRKRRQEIMSKEGERLIKNRATIGSKLTSIRGKKASADDITHTIAWLTKVSKYVPISSDRQLEEIIRVMVLLSEERAKYPQFYDKSGLELMKKVREGMIRYFVVLSELRAHRKEYLEYWFTDQYWITEWSHVLLDLAPDENMVKYRFNDVKAKDFLYILELELASADDASGLKKPMICLQPIENKNAFLIIPTENAAQEYITQVNEIIKEKITFTQWIKETLETLELPK